MSIKPQRPSNKRKAVGISVAGGTLAGGSFLLTHDVAISAVVMFITFSIFGLMLLTRRK